MARPISTEHDSGVEVSLPLAVSVIRELWGSRRYWSFNGFCSDLISVTALSINPLKSEISFFYNPDAERASGKRLRPDSRPHHRSPASYDDCSLTCAWPRQFATSAGRSADYPQSPP